MAKSSKTYLIFGFLLVISLNWNTLSAQGNDDRLQPYEQNSYYWQYKGDPVILLGATNDDNLFQMPNLQKHLEELHAAGGNYIRNTMSDRRAEGFELYPFKDLADHSYDLNQWNQEYWQRFEKLLQLTYEMDIIVQIEIWDRFDYSRENWLPHPYNPVNNINYSYEESGFQPEYPDHPGANVQPFFFTTPQQQNNKTVLQYQQKFVNKLLDTTLEYPNVLYCIDNETSGEEAWAIYWADYIQNRADAENREINITEMWDDWDLTADEHRRTLDHPERFDFVDLSQNNHQLDETHWQNFIWAREYMKDEPRPINNVKIYGADDGRHGGDNKDAIEKFWRLLFSGAASARFHRPESGLGLQDLSKIQLRSARMLLDEFDMFNAEPDKDHVHLSNRTSDEAYLTRIQGNQYAVFFTNGGDVNVDLPEADGSWQLRWLDILKSRWTEHQSVVEQHSIRLTAPGDSLWIALVQRSD